MTGTAFLFLAIMENLSFKGCVQQGNKIGGFSGRAIFPIAVKMIYQVYQAVKLPIMGIGGVSCAEDVIEMMLAGASAVQVGAENLVNPYACRDIINNLPYVMKKYKINSLSEIIGGAHE